MKKILILIPLIFLVTGCRVNYNLEINKDLTVTEQVKMTESPDYFENRYKELPKTVIDSILNSGSRKQILLDNDYDISDTKMNSYPAILATKTYNSLENYSKNTIFKDEFFKSFNIKENDNQITFEATDLVEYDSENVDLYDVAGCTISIKVPFVVTNSNADKHNRVTNTYTWTLSSENPKEIKITFAKNKLYVYNILTYISIFIIIVIILVIFIVVLRMNKKNKMNNNF